MIDHFLSLHDHHIDLHKLMARDEDERWGDETQSLETDFEFPPKDCQGGA